MKKTADEFLEELKQDLIADVGYYFVRKDECDYHRGIYEVAQLYLEEILQFQAEQNKKGDE